MADTDNAYSSSISPGTPGSEVDAATLDGASLSTDGTLISNSDALVPSQKAVKTFVEDLTDDLDDRVDVIEAAVVIDGSGNITVPGTIDAQDDVDITGALSVTGSAAITTNVGASTLSLSVADGTTPMTVTSTTKVSNLNVDKIDGCDVEDSDSLGTSDVKIPTQGNVKAYVDNAASIVGMIIALDKTMPSTPVIPASWKELDGSLVSDAESVYNGYRVRNLNGADVVLTLTWTADAGGAYASVTAANITALAVGDDVTGSGIAASSTIIDITAGVVTISDVSATGEIESTFTNRGRFLRGNSTSGDGKNDAMQRITGDAYSVSSGDKGFLDYQSATTGVFSTGPSLGSTSRPTQNDTTGGGQFIFDSADSTSPNAAKTDDAETYPQYLDVVWIMKIK